MFQRVGRAQTAPGGEVDPASELSHHGADQIGGGEGEEGATERLLGEDSGPEAADQ